MNNRTSVTCSIAAVLIVFVMVSAPLAAQRLPDPVVSRASSAMVARRPVPSAARLLMASPSTVRPLTRRAVLTVVDSDRLEYGSIGAGVGLLGGMVLGSEIANRCKPATSATCTSKGRRLRYILGFGVLGAVVGGATGALIADQ